MELNLLDQDIQQFRSHRSFSNRHPIRSIVKGSDIFRERITLNPIDGVTRYGLDQNVFRDGFLDLLFGNSELGTELKRGTLVRPRTTMIMNAFDNGKVWIEDSPHHYGDHTVDVFNGLYNLEKSLPPNSMEFTLTMQRFRAYSNDQNKLIMDFTSKCLKFIQCTDGTGFLEFMEIIFPNVTWWELWSDLNESFSAVMSLSVKFSVGAMVDLYRRRFARVPPSVVDVSTTSLKIIVFDAEKEEESTFNCHRPYLTEASPVFEAMFEADMQERKVNEVKIDDYSVACVRAMINFLKWGDLDGVLTDCEMVLELLQIANKYQVKQLIDVTLSVICAMPISWFSVDMVVELVSFTSAVEDTLHLANIKAWAVLKWYAKNIPTQVMESASYRTWLTNPKTSMDLVLKFLQDS